MKKLIVGYPTSIFVLTHPSEVQAMEKQDETFLSDRDWPEERFHPLPVPLKMLRRFPLSPITSHITKDVGPNPSLSPPGLKPSHQTEMPMCKSRQSSPTIVENGGMT
jgi:hypothetical protein